MRQSSRERLAGCARGERSVPAHARRLSTTHDETGPRTAGHGGGAVALRLRSRVRTLTSCPPSPPRVVRGRGPWPLLAANDDRRRGGGERAQAFWTRTARRDRGKGYVQGVKLRMSEA